MSTSSYMTAEEIAKRLGVCYATAQRRLNSPQSSLAPAAIGGPKRRTKLYDRRQANRWIQQEKARRSRGLWLGGEPDCPTCKAKFLEFVESARAAFSNTLRKLHPELAKALDESRRVAVACGLSAGAGGPDPDQPVIAGKHAAVESGKMPTCIECSDELQFRLSEGRADWRVLPTRVGD